MSLDNLEETYTSLLTNMENIASRIRELIINMPPHDLLGYIYSRYIMRGMEQQCIDFDEENSGVTDDLTNENQFLLEYVHAVLASDVTPEGATFDEERCTELFELAEDLRSQALLFAVVTSTGKKDGIFGPDTADIEFRAKTTWVMLRGNRYQVLEGEFYQYVLAPHDEVLKEVYGIGAIDIAQGFQAMSDATRSGYAEAVMQIEQQFEMIRTYAAAQDKPWEDAMKSWFNANLEQSKSAQIALDDMFRGGIINVSRHTKLPAMLLEDLAYRRGEETEFFAEGNFSGTPYRTLPARKKPLIQIETDYYAIDPCFTRDSGYRALLHNLLQRRPCYKMTFKERQKTMSESAFADILIAQLPKAEIFQEVYYKDPANNQWSENDTLILVDDVLFLVEAKAGAAATIASPALDFDRHAQSVQDLVIKAYKQCERFFNYLNSADQVPIFHLIEGRYEECGRICRSDYRLMLPIGLTVESFSPFSAYCKQLTQVEPLLGKHAFISLSIDDLFVLKRFLTTPGQFSHYMEVRQSVAGIRRAHLFDECDHLGAYLTNNRFDLTINNQLKNNDVDMIVWDGMSEIIDKSFEAEDWESRTFPTQDFPEDVLKLLEALDTIRAPGWLYAESNVRNLSQEGRNNLSKMLSELRQTLKRYPARYFTLLGDNQPLFIWIRRNGHPIEWETIHAKASAAALVVKSSNVIGIVAEVSSEGVYYQAQYFSVHIPAERTGENSHIYEDTEKIMQPNRWINLNGKSTQTTTTFTAKTGRNKPCPCGSGLKFKKCHAR